MCDIEQIGFKLKEGAKTVYAWPWPVPNIHEAMFKI